MLQHRHLLPHVQMKTQTAMISTLQTKYVQESKQVVEREKKTEKNLICRQVSWLSFHSETMPEAEKWLSNASCRLTHVSIYDRLLPTIWSQKYFVKGKLIRNARKAKIKGFPKDPMHRALKEFQHLVSGCAHFLKAKLRLSMIIKLLSG